MSTVESAIRGLRSFDETAQILGVSTATVRRLADREVIHSVRVGARRLVSTDEIARVVREGTGASRGASKAE